MAFTGSPSKMSFLIFVLMEFLCSYSMARSFHVGGDEGWTFRPSKPYNQWAEQYRFEINDTLVFNYEKGRDSVLVVNYNDYSKCNKENPKRVLKYNRSIFKLEKSGSFFFISGHNQNCEKGEKLVVVVPSPRHVTTAPSPSPVGAKTPTHAKTPSHSPAPSPWAKIPTNKPKVHTPSSHSPSTKVPTHQPKVHTPSHSPSAKIPTHKPQVHTPSSSRSPSPKAESPKNHNGAPRLTSQHHHHA